MLDPFVYQPPNERTTPKYARIREAERAATEACIRAMNVGAWRGTAPTDEVKAAAFAEVNAATKAFHDVIASECPPSADTSAALRCARIARMAANEVIAGDRINVGDIVRQVGDNLRAARWQACAAVALGDES